MHNWNDYPASRSARDVSFITPSFMDSADSGSPNGGPILGGTSVDVARPKFQHARSPSGASHASVGTTGSGTGSGRGGFVHPFQQTPRTATPPLLSYAGSMASIDAAGGGSGAGRDYSPTITENEDDEYDYQAGKTHPYALSQSSLRRPSLASQRTASFSDMHGVVQSSSSVKNNRAGSYCAGAGNPTSSRMVHGGSLLSASKSQSDLHLNLTLGTTNTTNSANDSATNSPSILSRSTTTTTTTTFPVLTSQPSYSFVTSPTSSFSTAPLSPLRTSLEMGLGGLAPRLRSLSEQQEIRIKKPSMSDPAEHARLMREARAKFDERERLKAEKAARKQQQKSPTSPHHRSMDIEKRDFDMYQRQKPDIALYSGGKSRPGTSSGTSLIYNRSSTNRSIYTVDQLPAASNEKVEGGAGGIKKGNKTGSLPKGAAGGLSSQQQKERKSAKNAWTNFVLWIRTTIFKIKRGD